MRKPNWTMAMIASTEAILYDPNLKILSNFPGLPVWIKRIPVPRRRSIIKVRISVMASKVWATVNILYWAWAVPLKMLEEASSLTS